MRATLSPARRVPGADGTVLHINGRREGQPQDQAVAGGTFQSISLFAICCYLATMAVLASAFATPAGTWRAPAAPSCFSCLSPPRPRCVLSERARGWIKVKLSKHLFEHRYDYRSEWLRFTETLGRSGPEARSARRPHRQCVCRHRRFTGRPAPRQRCRRNDRGRSGLELAWSASAGGTP